MAADFMLADWVERFGKETVSALELFLDDTETFVSHLPQDPRSYTRVERDGDGSITYVCLETHDLTQLVSNHSGIEDYPIIFGQWALENLARNAAVIRVNRGLHGAVTLFDNQIRPFFESQELDGATLGHRYFLPRRRSGIIEICVRAENGDLSTGTGFIVSFHDGSRRLVTCRHVLFDEHDGLRDVEFVRSENNKLEFQSCLRLSNIDICLVDLCLPNSITAIPMRDGTILDAVITAGFPRVFFHNSNSLLFHRGEINGWVGSKDDGNLFGVTSAAVAPGNSGGPVFNSLGVPVGVVAQQQNIHLNGEVAQHNFFIPTEQIRHELDAERYEAIDL